MHDAYFTGIDASDMPTKLVLTFRMGDGTIAKLNLFGCEIFRATDFMNQNIVSRMLCCGAEDANDKFLSQQLEWMTSLNDSSSYLNNDNKTTLLDRIKASDAAILVLEPSYGAEFAALYSNMEIEKEF